jgi:hypothetical protein
MNLEMLEKLVAAQVEEIKLPDDQTVFIQPMLAEDEIALNAWFLARGYGKEDDDRPVTAEELVAYHAFVLSKCIVEPRPKQGGYVKTLDSDRARELLPKIQGRRFSQLANAALRKSGMSLEATAKKNSAPKNDLLDGSASSGASSAVPNSSGDSLPQSNGDSGSASIGNATGEKIEPTNDSTPS